ncbi:hypothetical protein F4802DRAFT_522289 [Xylaria palmicola]|nr:hypothetical protein F4802DRAFT_522289 [Xylaria palmicola]
MAYHHKARTPRLRASCDGCFIAKVKCSKARPVCSRCLSCGIHCKYSPSSRAGKPKADSLHVPPPDGPPQEQQQTQPLADDQLAFALPRNPPRPFTMDWSTAPLQGVQASLPDMSMLGDGTMNLRDTVSAPSDFYPTSMPWATPACYPPADMSSTPIHDMDFALTPDMGAPLSRPQSFDASIPLWQTPRHDEVVSFSQVPSPTTIPSLYSPGANMVPPTPFAAPFQPNGGGSCRCFSICLQSLLSLHDISVSNAQAMLTLDYAIATNRDAVEGCAIMLACTSCFSHPHADTNSLLLATIFCKIASIYKNITNLFPEPGSMSPHGIPSLAIGGDGFAHLRHKISVLELEVRKLDQSFTRYRQISSKAMEDPKSTMDLNKSIGQMIQATQGIVAQWVNDTDMATSSG